VPKMQSKKHSLIETLTNQVVGIALGWSTMYWIMPLIGVKTNVSQASAASVIFFILSMVRSYVLRRIFNSITIRDLRDKT